MGEAASHSTGHASRAGGDRRDAPERVRPGDWIEVEGTRGADPRRGEIVAVVGAGQHTHFRVRWDEKHESLFYPGTGGYIVHAGA